MRASNSAAEQVIGDLALVPQAAMIAAQYAMLEIRPLLAAVSVGVASGHVPELAPGGAAPLPRGDFLCTAEPDVQGPRPILIDELVPHCPVSIARGMAAVAMLSSPWGTLVQPDATSIGLHPFARMALELT